MDYKAASSTPGKPICSECPYYGNPLVKGTSRNAEFLIVTAYPTKREAREGKLSDTIVNRALDAAKRDIRRPPEVGFTTAVQCFAPDTTSRQGKVDFERARLCCRPRLLKEIREKRVMALGNEAATSIQGRRISSITAREKELTSLGCKSFHASVSPAYVAIRGGTESTEGGQLIRDLRVWMTPSEKEVTAEILIDPPKVQLPPPGSVVVVDIETTGLEPTVWAPELRRAYQRDPSLVPADIRGSKGKARIRCYGFAWRESGEEVVTVFSKVTKEVKLLLSSLYQHAAHNYPFECKWLDAFGHKPEESLGWFDTMLQTHALHEDRGPGNYRLDAVAFDYLPGRWMAKSKLLFKTDKGLGPPVLFCPLPELMVYCGWDCLKELRILFQMSEGLGYEIRDLPRRPARARARVANAPRQIAQPCGEGGNRRAGGKQSVRQERIVPCATGRDRLELVAMPAARFLDRCTSRGLLFSPEAHAAEVAALDEEIATLEPKLKKVARIDWTKDAQVRALFKEMDLEASGIMTDAGLPSLDKIARKGILFLNKEHKKWLEVWDRYAIATNTRDRLGRIDEKTGKVSGILAHVQEDGCFHPTIYLAGPRTARLSAVNPGIQTFEKALKRCVVARPGYTFLEGDVSGAEIVWQAFESQDPKMLEAVSVKPGYLHDLVAAEIGIPRRAAKVVNFGSSYLGGPDVVLNEARKWLAWDAFTLEQCAEFQRRRERLFARYYEWAREIGRLAMKQGYVVSRFGAVRRLPAAQLGPRGGGAFHAAMRQAPNFLIQEPASTMVLLRGLEAEDALPWLRSLTLVHDAVLWEVKKGTEKYARSRIAKIMCNPNFYWGTLTPAQTMEFKCGDVWGDLHEMEVT